MLRFTAAGAVQAPRTLHVRVTASAVGRIPAGAPAPTGGLSAVELLDNLRWFSGGRGPRERPCDALVVSGDTLDDELIDVLSQAPSLGYSSVTRHIGRGGGGDFAASALATVASAAAVSVVDDAGIADLEALTAWSGHVVAAVLLRQQALEDLGALTQSVLATQPDRVVFTWPLTGAPPPPARLAGGLLRPALAQCDATGVAAGVKGLPACHLDDPNRLWKSRNRLYVDSDHQREQALLFFPDVVRFSKADACRFCAADSRCDGAPEAWLRAGLAGPLVPLELGEAESPQRE